MVCSNLRVIREREGCVWQLRSRKDGKDGFGVQLRKMKLFNAGKAMIRIQARIQ